MKQECGSIVAICGRFVMWCQALGRLGCTRIITTSHVYILAQELKVAGYPGAGNDSPHRRLFHSGSFGSGSSQVTHHNSDMRWSDQGKASGIRSLQTLTIAVISVSQDMTESSCRNEKGLRQHIVATSGRHVMN